MPGRSPVPGAPLFQWCGASGTFAPPYTETMTIAKKNSPDVNPEAASLLERAYALDSDDKSRALYRDWAETYDATMLEGLQYRSPALVATALGAHLADRDGTVLDIGCGTGLVGQVLAELGYEAIDGLDISTEMMQVAARRGVYRHFLAADLNHPLDMPDAQYDGATCCGTFTHGHVDARCLGELFRVLRPGALFSFTVKLEVWEPLGFKDTLARLVADGRIVEVASFQDRYFDNSAQSDGVFCVYRRT